MKRIIELDKEKRKFICETFGVTQANLSQALRFKRNSKKAIAMRVMAIEHGGTLLEEPSEAKSVK